MIVINAGFQRVNVAGMRFLRNTENYRCFRRVFSETTEKSSHSESIKQTQLLGSDNLSEEENVILNKSRLNPVHYNMNKYIFTKPTSQQTKYVMTTLKWQRMKIGTCGLDCGYDPALCFTTKEEIEDLKAYEKVAFNKSIMEMRNNLLEDLARKKEETREREERAKNAMQSMESWKNKIKARLQEKENIATAAKEERSRLLEEVRRFFGYTIDPKDERFQLMLQHKENEIAKQKKLLKKQKQEERFMAKLAALERDEKSGKEDEIEKKEDENN